MKLCMVKDEIVEALEKSNPHLRSVDVLDLVNICNEYVEKEKRKISTTKSFVRLVQRYFQAKDQKLDEVKKLEAQIKRTIKQVLK